MIYRIIFLSLFLCALISISNFEVKAQTSEKTPRPKQFRSPFRYVITSDKTDEDSRFVEILMDRKSFSKKNLITLFKLVSKRFPNPDLLFVNVYTDLEDVETPEEREQGKFSEGIFDSDAPNMQDSATFTRYKGEMSFNINYANGDLEKVEIK